LNMFVSWLMPIQQWKFFARLKQELQRLDFAWGATLLILPKDECRTPLHGILVVVQFEWEVLMG